MPTAGRPRLPVAVYVLGATSLLNDAASEMIYPLLPLFLSTSIGVGPAVIGLIEGIADAIASLLKLASGHLSDRAGRRKPFVVAGYLLASIARPLVAFATTPLHVLFVRVSDRFGKGLRSSPRDALIADVTPRLLHGRAFGLHQAMDDTGAVIGPLVAFALLSAGLQLRSVFLLAAIPALASCALVVAFVRDAGTRAPAKEPAGAASGALLSRPFTGYLAAIVLFALGNSTDAFLLLRAHEAGIPPAAVPLLWALHHLVKAIAGTQGGALADAIGRRRALALGWLVYAGVYAGFALVSSVVGVISLFFVYGLHFALVSGAQKAIVAELVPAASRARGFGLYHMCVGAAALPASVIFGLLYERLGPRTAFFTGAALALAATCVLPLSRPAARRGAAD